MKDEIKEILDKLRSDNYYEKEYQKSVYYERDLKKLENCLTNLQEELKGYKQERENLFKAIHELQKEIKKDNHILGCNFAVKDKYKSRIDKAIEYINTHYLNANEPELENILNGGDKE